jgi:hypothetical protein
MIRKLLAGPVAVALVAGFAAAAEIKSGPQPGEQVPGPFTPLNVTGEDAGKKQCLVCKNGTNPVVMIFARSADAAETKKLIKAVDAATAKHSDCDMGSFVVVLTDDEDKAGTALKEFADREKLKKVVLSTDSPAGPPKYKVSKDADVTVVLYTRHEVKANHAFKKGELKDKDIDAIVADVAKIVPQK